MAVKWTVSKFSLICGHQRRLPVLRAAFLESEQFAEAFPASAACSFYGLAEAGIGLSVPRPKDTTFTPAVDPLIHQVPLR